MKKNYILIGRDSNGEVTYSTHYTEDSVVRANEFLKTNYDFVKYKLYELPAENSNVLKEVRLRVEVEEV